MGLRTKNIVASGENNVHSKLLKALPGGYNWSPEDLAAYKLWRRWLFIIYGSIGVAAIATAIEMRIIFDK
jgi:hypothetical protein